MGKGLVVPDNPAPTEYKTVAFRIPDDPQWIGIIAGLLYSPCNGYWWKKSSGDWETARDTMCAIATEFNTVDFCEQVDECIIENGGTQTIINNTVNNYYYGDKDGGLGNGIMGVDTCDYDVLFGITTQLVDYLDSQAREAFQVIEEASNNLELITNWIDNIPIANLTIGYLLEYAQWILDTVAEEYEQEWGTALRDEYRCDLFCTWNSSSDCSLSVRDIAEYFANRLLASFDIFTTFQNLVDFLLTGTWSGTQIVDVMFLAMTGIMALDDIELPFITIKNIYSYETVVALASNDPDPDWMILCDECNIEWCRHFDFTTGQHGWESLNIGVGWGATYVAGVGWKPVVNTSASLNNLAASIGYNFATNPSFIHELEFGYDMVKGTYTKPSENMISGATYSPYVLSEGQPANISPNGDDLVGVVDYEQDISNYVSLVVRPSRKTGTTNGDCTITSATLRGRGTPPTDGEAC